MLIGTAVCGKPHVRWCERAGEIKPSPLYLISCFIALGDIAMIIDIGERLYKRSNPSIIFSCIRTYLG